MVIGTAGFTAMQMVLELEAAGLAPGKEPVLVLGAAGGAGSMAVGLLAARGYEVRLPFSGVGDSFWHINLAFRGKSFNHPTQ